MGTTITDLYIELKMNLSRIGYLENKKTHIIVSILWYMNSNNCKKIQI